MKKVILFGLLAFTIIKTQAQEFKSGKYHSNEAGLMLQGYDPVSYFQAEGPKKGLPEMKVQHDGVHYHFSTSENMNLFKTNPDKYLPAYGGFCAFGMGMDPEKVGGFPQGRYKTSPLSFKLIGQKLYLFYPENEWKALRYWNQDEANLKQRADKLWAEIKDH